METERRSVAKEHTNFKYIVGQIFAQLLFCGQKTIDVKHKFEYTIL